jgi:hypothetical protein
VKNVQKVLDAETWACQNGLTDRRNSDGQASKCFKSSKKRLTGKSRCAKLASLIQAAPAAPQEQQKVLDRQKQVCETGFTERNATTGSKSSKKVLDPVRGKPRRSGRGRIARTAGPSFGI